MAAVAEAAPAVCFPGFLSLRCHQVLSFQQQSSPSLTEAVRERKHPGALVAAELNMEDAILCKGFGEEAPKNEKMQFVFCFLFFKCTFQFQLETHLVSDGAVLPL